MTKFLLYFLIKILQVSEAMCFVNINGSWLDLQMIITKNTVDDMIKIGAKLILFFKVFFF